MKKLNFVNQRRWAVALLSEIKEHEQLGVTYMEQTTAKIIPKSEPGKHTPAGL